MAYGIKATAGGSIGHDVAIGFQALEEHGRNISVGLDELVGGCKLYCILTHIRLYIMYSLHSKEQLSSSFFPA